MALQKYTPEIEAKITTQYLEGTSTDEIALELGVSRRSVISKLSALGVYKKKPYTNKLGEIPVKKEHYVSEICKKLNINEELADSLAKVNKSILKLILDNLS